MMASNKGDPVPPPAPVAPLPWLPSNAKIVRPRNADVSLLILRAVLSRGAHHPGGNTYREVAALLWENLPVVTGPFFGRFQEWAPTQIQRNIKERASSIIGHYSVFEPDAVPHLTPLQRLASQFHNEITAIAEAENTRREVARLAAESRQAANSASLGRGALAAGATWGLRALSLREVEAAGGAWRQLGAAGGKGGGQRRRRWRGDFGLNTPFSILRLRRYFFSETGWLIFFIFLVRRR
jgi:hypothetical protein